MICSHLFIKRITSVMPQTSLLFILISDYYFPYFRKFYERLMEHDLYPMLEDRNRQYTIFAFNNSGYYHMNRTQYGEEIIEPEFNDKFGWVRKKKHLFCKFC